jgi:hypothetical protein
MMGVMPDYDDTDMTNEDFEAAFARAEPVDLLTSAPSFSWSERWGVIRSGSSGQGNPGIVIAGGLVAWSVGATRVVSTGDREAAAV